MNMTQKYMNMTKKGVNMDRKDIVMAALIRAEHAVWQTAAATLPAAITITPQMIKHFDINIILAFLTWFLTALLAGALSFVKSMAAGMPEIKLAQNMEMDIPEPEGSYRETYMSEEEKDAIRKESRDV